MTAPESPYRTVHAQIADPETFWLDAAGAIGWDSPPTRAFDAEQGVDGRWFRGSGS